MSNDSDKARVQSVRILLLEDIVSDAELIEAALAEAGVDFVSLRVETGEAFSRALDDFRPDIILSDFSLPSFDGRTALTMVQQRCPATPMVMVTGAIGDERAVELLKAGARDYVLKNHLVRLPSAVRRALAEAEETRQRQAAQQALRESEEKFRSLAENLPDMVVRYDLDCRRTYVNPAFEWELEIPAGEALEVAAGTHWRGSISAPDYRARLREVMATGIPADLTLSWLRSADGGMVDHAIRIVAERGPDGRIKGALAIGRNITALVEARHQLEESRTQLRALAARREAAREEERRRIARELHDELGQQLSALRFGVSLIDYQFGDQQPRIRGATAKLLDMVDKTIQVTRDVSSSLRPGVLDMGIVPALEWLAEEFSRHTGIRCELKVPQGEIQIDEDLAIAVFRIAQESLTNAARHAKAGNIQITFECDAGSYVLEVKDDGVGFDVSAPRKKTSFGLVGIRERVLATGGEVVVSSAPGCGTVVGVRIPMAAGKKDES
jgi:PAS domain S-box-containing protein